MCDAEVYLLCELVVMESAEFQSAGPLKEVLPAGALLCWGL